MQPVYTEQVCPAIVSAVLPFLSLPLTQLNQCFHFMEQIDSVHSGYIKPGYEAFGMLYILASFAKFQDKFYKPGIE